MRPNKRGTALAIVILKYNSMKNMNHPAFILAILGTIFIVGGLLTMPYFLLGTWLLYLGILLAGIFWVWAILDIMTVHHLKLHQRMFWLILAISVPVMGGLLYYVMHQDRNSIVT